MMPHQSTRRACARSFFIALCSLLAIVVAAGCEPHKASWKTPHMTPPSPRVAAAFAKTRTICFDRFLIDVPEGTEVIWGGQSVPLTVDVGPGRATELASTIAEKEAELKAAPRYPTSKNLNLYFETIDGAVPGMRHILSQESFDGDGLLRINSYFAMGTSLVAMEARPLEKDKMRALGTLNDIAKRLRPRDNHEIPAEAGLCIGDAFLADPAQVKDESRSNFLNIGFRLKVFPDVHLSLSLMPTNPDESLQWSLDNQLKITEDEARKEGRPDPFGMMTTLRRGKREIGDWKDGFEIITITPDQPKALPYQDFLMRFRGQPDKALFPHIDLAMQTGVGENGLGKVKPSLSNDEAIALWDAITSTIRPRPVGGARTSDASPPLAPLGTLAATGRTCPQTGTWECVEEDAAVQSDRRRFVSGGERMPHVVLFGKPSLWQKLKGDRPTHRTGTVWKLVSYENTAVPATASVADPSNSPKA